MLRRMIGALFCAAAMVVCAPTLAAGQSAPGEHASAPVLKRKVAIARFTNITRYGKALLSDHERDPLADQAADILTARLVDSGKFIVFERSDPTALKAEQALDGGKGAPGIGVDAVVIGSVTEFGRKVEGSSGFLNSRARQIVSAVVEVRLVDVRTGQAFFSGKGSGSATQEQSEVAGFGSRSGYDGTLNDKAISAAISDLMTNVMQKLQERAWSTDVLQVRGGNILISGGASQGLRVGDRLRLETRGETMTSGQTGLPITLPGERLGTLEVVSFFGDAASGEGSVTRLVSGQLGADAKQLIVVEDR